MHVDRLPSGAYRVRVSVNGQRASATRRTRREAEIAGGELLAELGATPTASSSVRELLDVHLAGHGYAPTTVARLRWAMDKLPPAFLERPVYMVTAPMIDGAYAAMLKGGASVHAVRAAHTLLSSAMSRAVRWGWIPRNPARDAAPPAEPHRDVEPPADVDVLRALEAAGGQLVAFLTLSAVAGARRGELCGLQWRDLELEPSVVGGVEAAGAAVVRRAVVYTPATGLVVNEGKTGRRGHRTLALDVDTVALLRAHRAERAEDLLALGLGWRDEWFVFSSTAGERPWRPDYASWRWRKLRAELGLETVRLHDLRHYMATVMLADGVSPTIVAGRLGHSTTATTLRTYAHFLPAADVAAVDGLAARLGRRRTGT